MLNVALERSNKMLLYVAFANDSYCAIYSTLTQQTRLLDSEISLDTISLMP